MFSSRFKKYYFKIFSSQSFKKKPITTLLRCFLLVFSLVLNLKFKYKANFGEKKFKIFFVPLEKNMGGRGFFVERENIEPLMKFGHKLINKDDVCIDGGANQGIFTLAFLSQIGPNGKVFSIEPFEYSLEILKKNLLINNYQNCKIFQGVLSDQHDQEYELNFSKGVGKASIVFDRVGKNNIIKKKTVKSFTVDEIMKGGKVDFIKLDIEGAEFLALQGGKKTIENFKPKIVVESRPKEFNHIKQYLNKFGYEPFVFSDNGSLLKINTIEKYENNIFFLINKI